MRIVFTGGGSGGHFYPIIAIAESVRDIAQKNRLVSPELYYLAPDCFDPGLLFTYSIKYVNIPAGKLRIYFSLKNIFDTVRTIYGITKAIFTLFKIYPDVIVGKGGFGSAPTLFAARFWAIPVIIHESDSVPGRANVWAGKFAKRVAVSFQNTAGFFPLDKTAYTGNPIRRSVLEKEPNLSATGAFNLSGNRKVILVIGGSLGARKINESILQILPELTAKYEIIHQTGARNLSDIESRSSVLIQGGSRNMYHPFAFLSTEELAYAYSIASLVISRAGSALFEIAAHGVPSILIPITESNGDHQRENAYAYAESGATTVLEESNLTKTLLFSEIEKILENEQKRKFMAEKALRFAKLDAADIIAGEIIRIALKHEN